VGSLNKKAFFQSVVSLFLRFVCIASATPRIVDARSQCSFKNLSEILKTKTTFSLMVSSLLLKSIILLWFPIFFCDAVNPTAAAVLTVFDVTEVLLVCISVVASSTSDVTA
jgi:hypothetical protein